MQVIPVIDLKGGVAVHARRGDRANYRPLAIRGHTDGDPLGVVESYRAIHPFTTLYVADLDAIAGSGSGDPVLAAIRQAHPGVELLVDNGTNSAGKAETWLARGLGRLVIGSETMPPHEMARDLDCPLSLDYRGDAFQGPPGLDRDPSLWPRDVIFMTLARVGSGEGPDTQRLGSIVRMSPRTRVFAAGGVRHADDLQTLQRAGAHAVLVATCLHDGSVNAGDIAAVA